MDYTIFMLQQSIDAECKVYSELKKSEEDIIVIPKYEKELEEHEKDIQALSDYFPEVKNALEDGTPTEVAITLQDLNVLCPRNRVRIDSYNRLVKVLKSKNINLQITSRKSHGKN